MRKPDFPADEDQRVQALRDLQVLDTPPEERFDRLARIARAAFKTPIALVSLVDSDRQWFKSRQGLDAPQTSRDISFCGHAILDREVFYVPNAMNDERFADNPLVSAAPHIRFYAGAPLSTADGHRIGTLCVIDSKPHQHSPKELELLRDLADCVEQELNQIRANEAVRTLADHSSYLGAVLETAIDGIITIDEGGIVQTLNPAAQRLFGYSATETLGRNLTMLMPEPYANAHDTYVSNYLQSGQAKIIGFGREVKGRRKDGSTFPMELAVSEMTQGGERHFVGIVRDISERKRVERLQSEFVSTVSHELRTPLTSIRGALGLVLGTLSGQLPDTTRNLLETANRNSEQLTVLINDILDLEKIESGRLEFEFKTLDLVQVAQQALAANEAYARQHQVRLRLTEHPERACIRGDEHRLMQVFANLLSNAIKYSPSGGEVEVSIRERGGHYRLSVRDHGRGIPLEFRNRVFERFAQADSSDTREKGGTGLGLSITRAIVKQHQGRIDYTSEEGVGTEFFFELPVWREVVEAQDSDPHRRRALICEDDPDVAFVLGRLLEQEGWVSDIAATLAAARTLLANKNYHALLLDLQLPDGDGLTLLRALRKRQGTRELPVIVISSRAEESRATGTVEALAVTDWLQKPVDQKRLVRVLRSLLQPNDTSSRPDEDKHSSMDTVTQELNTDVG